MEIKIINAEGWSKAVSVDKPIIRVGNSISADVKIRDERIPALLLQIFVISGENSKITMRAFSDTVFIKRGMEGFYCSQAEPYEIFVGDIIQFFGYELVFDQDDTHNVMQTSEHMSAVLKLSSPILSAEIPIRGELILKNTGTEYPCQFTMALEGLPAACMESDPLPFLHPGSSSTVSFLIKHHITFPAPGIHRITISLSAPRQYLGESILFHKNLFVNSVFKSDFVLYDDMNPIAPENILKPKASVAAEEKKPDEEKPVSGNEPQIRKTPETRNEAEILEQNSKITPVIPASEPAEVKEQKPEPEEDKAIRVINGKKARFEDEKPGSAAPEPEPAKESVSSDKQPAPAVNAGKNTRTVPAKVHDPEPERTQVRKDKKAEKPMTDASQKKDSAESSVKTDAIPAEPLTPKETSGERPTPAPEPEPRTAAESQAPEEAPEETPAAAAEPEPQTAAESQTPEEAPEDTPDPAEEIMIQVAEELIAPEGAPEDTPDAAENDEPQTAAEPSGSPESDTVSEKPDPEHIHVFGKENSAMFDDEVESGPEPAEDEEPETPKIITMKGSPDAFE